MATVETLDARLIALETEFRTELKHLATKADLKDLEVSLGGRIDQVDARIDKLEARMVKWAVGLLVAIAGVGVGLALLIQRAL
jgi:hypothetical protein